MKKTFLEFFVVIFLAFIFSFTKIINVDNSHAETYTSTLIQDRVVMRLNEEYVLPTAFMNNEGGLIELATNKNLVVRAYPTSYQYIEPESKKYSKIQLECLARNIYFESRGEGKVGMAAVGYVTMNRVYSNEYPKSICGVVYQGERTKNGNLYKCQFSWVCDGTIKQIRNFSQWKLAKSIANKVANSYSRENDPTYGSLFYHAKELNRPFRNMKVTEVIKINNHIFYRKKYS